MCGTLMCGFLTTAKTSTCFWFVLQASADMEEIFLFIDNLNKRLARGIKDLDDVRSSMAALSEIRESEIRFVLVHYREEKGQKQTESAISCTDSKHHVFTALSGTSNIGAEKFHANGGGI